MNTVQLVGRLTKEVDLKFTSSGTAVGSFTLAVNRNFTNQQGEREADFINCVIWRKAAENLANFTRKGSQIGVEGRIQTRNYENQQGQRVYVTEVVVNNFHLLEPRSVTEQRPKDSQSSNQGITKAITKGITKATMILPNKMIRTSDSTRISANRVQTPLLIVKKWIFLKTIYHFNR